MIYDNIFEREISKVARELHAKGTINKLEEQAELSKGSVCKWGKSVSPTVKNIKKVADILGCTVDELITEKKSKRK